MAELAPSFLAPPVIERVLGAQFNPIQAFTNAHLGAFWTSLGPEWPEVTDAPLLPQEQERFGKERIWDKLGLIRLSLTDTPAARVQIRRRDGNRMIQVQNGRILYNWLGRGVTEYVRYPALRGEFLEIYERFRQFLAGAGVGEPRLNQWEVTYVNHLPIGTVWNTPNDWNRVFSSQVSLPVRVQNSELESFSGQWHYVIGQNRGRLHVELRLGWEDLQNAPAREILIFKLTARGPTRPEVDGSLESGLDLGHDTIVNSFKQLTSAEARKVWEQQ